MIGFRIWNPVEKKFHYSGRTPSMLEGFFRDTAIYNTFYNMPYEQETGLTDENEKDIYE